MEQKQQTLPAKKKHRASRSRREKSRITGVV